MTYEGLSRRRFVLDLGKGGLAVAIFGMTMMACSGDDDPASAAASTTSAAGSTEPPDTTTSTTETTSTSAAPQQNEAGFVWERVNLGFVSAYVLARNGEAVVVDTGVSGSESEIAASLGVLGLGWENVGHVIVTHLHNDHQGSLPAVMELAPDATGYAGAEDIPAINSPRELTAVGDGDKVFDLEIIATPGHTPGHISVLDPVGSLLIAGDALNGDNGGIIGANPQFTEDMASADTSAQKLAALAFETIVFGHGEPVAGGASQMLREFLAAG